MTIKLLFDDGWLKSIKNAKNSWVSDVLKDLHGSGGIYLRCISKWFSELPGSNKQKNHLRASLKSKDNSDHLGAVNELSWWKFLTSRGFELEPIPTGKSKTPDFTLKFMDHYVVFEVTTLNPSKDKNCSEINNSQDKSLRRITAKAYEEKMDQFKYGHQREIPSVLVLFNYDEWSGFGTQFHRKIDCDKLFPDKLPELSSIIYVERFVIDGKPKIKGDSIVVVDNPSANFPFVEEIKKQIISIHGNDSWINCDNS
jgi:hypothetical protein